MVAACQSTANLLAKAAGLLVVEYVQRFGLSLQRDSVSTKSYFVMYKMCQLNGRNSSSSESTQICLSAR